MLVDMAALLLQVTRLLLFIQAIKKRIDRLSISELRAHVFEMRGRYAVRYELQPLRIGAADRTSCQTEIEADWPRHFRQNTRDADIGKKSDLGFRHRPFEVFARDAV